MSEIFGPRMRILVPLEKCEVLSGDEKECVNCVSK